MTNEQHNFSDHEGAEVSALLGTLRRVDAPGDFNFRVKARIAQGRPAKAARPLWATMALRLSLPAVVMATAGGYLGYRSLSSDNFSVAAVNDVQTAAPVTSVPTQSFVEPATALPKQSPSDLAPAVTPESIAAASEQPSRTAKPTPKQAIEGKPQTDRPAGGSFVIAGSAAKTITQPDIDDNDPKPDRKVIVSAAQFLSSSGVAATSAGAGGKISSVSGAAAQAGLRAGDVIESVSVVAGTIRVNRDGKSLTVVIK
jgi:hypothetical protein